MTLIHGTALYNYKSSTHFIDQTGAPRATYVTQSIHACWCGWHFEHITRCNNIGN